MNTTYDEVSVVYGVSGPAGSMWAQSSEALSSGDMAGRGFFFDDMRVGVLLALKDFRTESARGYSACSLGRIGTFLGDSAFGILLGLGAAATATAVYEIIKGQGDVDDRNACLPDFAR